MKYYVIAGEASGDLHGSNLIKAIASQDPKAEFRAWGGDLMQAQGADLQKHYRDLAFMGFLEVLKNIRTILKNIRFCKDDILQWKPDALILIDYPGFNLRIAEWAKKQNIRVFYYISPQVWAWNTKRVHKIKRIVDRLFVVLPFEKDFYKEYDYEVDFVGHPLLDVVHDKEKNPNFLQEQGLNGKPIIALLPGSRKQEIRSMLERMLSIQSEFPRHQFVIAGAPSIPAEFYEPFLQKETIQLVENKTYELLMHSKAALVTSGTATLETALFDVPQVVCYRGNTISYFLARQLIKVKFIALVNLIMDREIVKELIQFKLNSDNLKTELAKVLEPEQQVKMKRNYIELRKALGGAGASKNTADLILKDLNK